MKRAFSFEGPLFSFLSKLADLVWLNLLFIITCIPIVTIGASVTALHYVTLKMVKDEESYITKLYFKSFKENFLQATAIWLIYVVAIIILVCDIWVTGDGSLAKVINNDGISNAVLVVVGIVTLLIVMSITYVFPVLAKFENTVKNTIKNAFLISIRHLPYTFLMIIISVIPVVIVYFYAGAMIIILIQFSLVAYINSKFYSKIFENYVIKEEPVDNIEEVTEETN